MKKYLVTFNWYGGLHKFYTMTFHSQIAIKNAKIRLAKKLGVDLSAVTLHLSKGNKITVYEVKKWKGNK